MPIPRSTPLSAAARLGGGGRSDCRGLLALRRFQRAGHLPIALVGGATGLVGDPSFKAHERQLNSRDVVQDWVEKIREQVCRFIDFDCGPNSARVV